MRAVILTAPGLEHAYVTNTLLNAVGDHVVAVVLESRATSMRGAIRRYSLPRVAERLATKAIRRVLRFGPRTANALRSVLGECTMNAPLVLETPNLNDEPTLQAVRAWNPTHVFVYGTGIVGKVMRSVAPVCLNMHTGISPYYRGADAEFWPLYDGRPDLVGATVHDCVQAVDGGPIYATARATLRPGDDVFTAFARCVQVGAPLYADIARQLAAGEELHPQPQDHSIGRAYRFIDRTWLHDIRMEWRRLRTT